MRIYLDHRFVPEKKALVSVFDHGFLYGDGVFETVRAYEGRLFRVDDHLKRLKESAKNLEIRLPHTLSNLRRLLYQTLSINRLKNALLRITLTRGSGPIGLDPALCRKATLVIIPRDFRGCPPEQYRRGMNVSIVSACRTPPQVLDPRIKSLNFLNNILAVIQAKQVHADEGLMLTMDGCLAEGSTSNIFLIKQGRLYTPASNLGILAGITRQVVLDLTQEAGLPVKEARLTPGDLYKAEESFLTNTSMEVMPVVTVDGMRIGQGRPGPITLRLHKAFQSRVRYECGIAKKELSPELSQS